MKDKQCLEPAERLPNGWGIKKINEVSTLIRGLTYKPEQVKSKNNGIACFRTKNIQSELDESDIVYIDENIIKSNEKYLQFGDVLVSSANSLELLGKCCIIKELNYKATLGGFICAFRPDIKVINYKYFYYYFGSIEFQEIIRGYANKTTGIANLSVKKVEQTSIQLPDLNEQKQIVSVLDKTFEKLDQAIALVEKNIQKLKQLNESVLDEIFRNSDKFVSFLDYVSVSRKTITPELDKKYNIIGLENIESNSGKLVNFKPIMGSESISSKVIFKKGNILYGKLRPYLNKVYLAEFDGIATTEIIPFTVDKNMFDEKYILYFLRSPFFLEKVNLSCSGARMPRVTTEFWKTLLIPFLTISEQQRIVEYLDQTTDKNQKLTQYYQNKLEALKRLKNSVLDSAFKGALRRAKVIQFKAKTFNELYPDPYIRKNREIQKKNNARRSVLTTARIIDIHQKNNQKLGHTKVEKINHAIEYIVGYELYRDPVKDVGGPVDFYYLNKYVEPFAKEKKVFEAIKTEEGYYYETKENFNLFLDLANNELGEFNEPVNQLIQEFVFLSLRETELYMTVYAGWNNLIIRKEPVSLESIYNESITLWSNKADKFDKDDVQNAINWLNNKKYIPKGNGKEVK